MTRDDAEIIALRGLAHVVGDATLAAAFLSATGLSAAALRGVARDPQALGAVLDFLLAEDARVLALAAAAGCAPEDVARARQSLPGGETPHWT